MTGLNELDLDEYAAAMAGTESKQLLFCPGIGGDSVWFITVFRKTLRDIPTF